MWQVEWKGISARIGGIIGASQFLFQTAQAGESDSVFSTDILIENCHGAAAALELLSRYKQALPGEARDALRRFDDWWTKTVLDTQVANVSGFPAVQALVVLLASVRAELDHVITDHDAVIRSHVERAFLHLQRSLVVDEDLRTKWLVAFQKHETACEQLGALHLLLHGIWAFKTDAKGERTDLMLGTKLADTSNIVRATHGMVLTEWKLVRDGQSAEAKATEALEQAVRYSVGSLAGYELEAERYLVLVGEKPFDLPMSMERAGIVYRLISVILSPRHSVSGS